MLRWMMLLIFVATAAVKDWQDYHIPNLLLVAGVVNGALLRLIAGGITALGYGILGALIPFVVCWILFSLSMFGAGDIKLLMVVGVYAGPGSVIAILILSFFMGAGIAVVRMMVDSELLVSRLTYLSKYIDRRRMGYSEAYIDMEDICGCEPWIMPFSVPVFAAVLLEIILHIWR